MIVGGRLVDVKAYQEWVRSDPDITGFNSYWDAWLVLEQKKERKSEQKTLAEVLGCPR